MKEVLDIALFGSEYYIKIPMELDYSKIKITEIKYEKNTVYCCFDNIKDFVKITDKVNNAWNDNCKEPINSVKNDLETIFNNNVRGYIKIQKNYLDEQISFVFSVDYQKISLLSTNEYFEYGGLPRSLIMKVNKWFREHKENVRLNEVIKTKKIKEREVR